MAAPDDLRMSPRISSARLALAAKRLRADRADLDPIASDPIAIIGMGCRFPGGASSPEQFWTALAEGRNCVGIIPDGRWKDSASLPIEILQGGYLPDVDLFDAAYFGISPREAQHMDPQQRLLLEVVWESLWDAGIEPASLAQTDTGVFVAIYNNDYSRLDLRDPSCLTAHAGIGAAHSVAAGRLSFLLNLKGPNLALDSACSSSLVATHLACQSLRARECGLAIVAASSLKLLSDEVVVFSKWGMLSSDGKCKTFDARADGFAPGEGSGAVVLKRLSDALQDRDRIRAVIRGTAVNHDGRTTVLTAPNGLAQEAVLRAALKNAMLAPHEIGYIEAHGTGTSLGDPIEMEAVGNVYGAVNGDAGVEASPCVLGAVKTNLGHLEAAAGIAGLIKAVLCLERGAIPKNLHFTKLNPEISLAGTRLALATENQPWPRRATPRVAGISSFGLGGTNSHVIVEEAPLLPAQNPAAGGRTIPLPAYSWRRERFWLPDSPVFAASIVLPVTHQAKLSLKPAAGSVHPLLGKQIDSPFVNGMLFASNIDTTVVAYLAEHRLGDRPIMPFAAFLEIAAAALRESETSVTRTIRNFTMREPLFLSSSDGELQTYLSEDMIEIASRHGSQWSINARCSLQPTDAHRGSIDLPAMRARIQQEVLPSDVYQRLERTGLHYGTAFRVIQSAWAGDGESLVRLRLPDGLRKEAPRYGLHSTLLDGCLQTVVVARGETGTNLFLPISLDRFELQRTGTLEVWVHTQLTADSAETISADIDIADLSGNRVARLTGFTAKRAGAELLARELAHDETTPAYEIVWRKCELPPVSSSPTSSASRTGQLWLLIENRDRNCGLFANTLRQQGAICEIVSVTRFDRSIFARSAWTGIVYDARGVEHTRNDSRQDNHWSHPEQPAVEFLLKLAKSVAASRGAAPRLWIVSSSTMAVLPGEDVAVEQGSLSGLARTLSLEYPELAPVLVDLGPEANTHTEAEAMLADEIFNGAEPLTAFRQGKRYVARLVRREPENQDSPRKLQFAASGRLEDMRIEPAVRNAPEPNEVEIEVRAAGLNFRDVLTALGMLTARAFIPGAECAGTIVRVGSKVTGWKIGDHVLAFAPSSLQSFVNVPADFIAAKPNSMTFADAAGIPVAFLTALYGLERLARLSAGQSILIHAAAGGLGLAATQLALRSGAKVFATAGSPEKREFLRQFGVDHVFDSRSLSFREDVLCATGGRGVDVVLNSLAGEFIAASFETIAVGGCFLEVGKRGIWSEKEVAALGRGIRYFPFDLGDVGMENSAAIAGMLRDLMTRFSGDELRPLPTALYSLADATNAFRTMAQARHIGKIVLGVSGRSPRAGVRDLVSGGTVLIFGGLGALGLETARWLTEQGARNIILAGRHADPHAQHSVVAELRSQGVNVAIERADVAVASEVATLLQKIRATHSPLRAVFHAAGIVQDSVLEKESWSSYREATAPKIQGAWNLHRLTAGDPVRLMVFFSSAASILGSPGQGSYAAGNAFLDKLAHHRASCGFRTLSVNWGPWASAGMAARLSAEQSARWARQGVRAMEAGKALAALQIAIEQGDTQVAIIDIHWGQFLNGVPARRDAALFTELQNFAPRESRSQKGENGEASAQESILKSLRSALPADRESILSPHLKACARRVLGLGELATIEDTVPLQDIGLDSLMALEMRNELAQSLALSLPAGLLFDYPAVAQLTQHLLGLLAASSAVEAAADGSDRSVAGLNSLSEEEAERLLIEELDRAGKEKVHA